MLVRSWFVLFGLVALSALSLAGRRNHYYEKRTDYTDKRRDSADNRDGDKKSADDRSDAVSKVPDSAGAHTVAVQNLAVQSQQDNSVGTLASFAELLEFSKPRPDPPKAIKTYIVTKKVPVPYPVQYETRVPYPIKVPIRRPYAVYVPKPFYYEVPKPMPYTVKVPLPQPYHIEKHIPYPYKVPIDKPVPVHIAKPYPVFVEKKVPVPIEKEVPVQINIPVERPIPVEIPVKNPVPVLEEKPTLYPVKFPVENQGISLDNPLNSIEGTTTYEVNIKDVPQIVNAQQLKFPSPENHDFITPLKTSIDFSPSPYDSFSSSLSDGKQQVISFVPEGHQNSAFQTVKHGYTFEPLTATNSQEAPKWAQINSTDWIPRVVSYQTKVNPPEALKLVSSQNENEPKATDLETKHFHHELKRDEVPSFQQSQVYNFISVPQKVSTQKTSVPFSAIQQNSQKQGEGNYQFYNVHPVHGLKTENGFSSISYQKFETEPKSSVEPSTQWIQVQRDPTPQASYLQQQQQQLTQQNNRDVQHQSTSQVGQQAQQNFIVSQDYEQYKELQNSINREQQQIKQNFIAANGYNRNQFNNNIIQEQQISLELPQNNQQGPSQPELNQFTNQNFPQLQQYHQQISSQPQQHQQNVPDYQTEKQTPTNYQNQQHFSAQNQYQQQSSSQANHQHRQLQQHHQLQQQQVFQHEQPQHFQQAAPQQYHQQTQYHPQTVSPAHQFQNTFEQKQQLEEQDVQIFLGQGPNGHRRRHRQPNGQQVSQTQQLLAVSPDQQATTETILTNVSSSTEQPQRVRKTRRRNRKRNNNNINNNNTNNNVETTTAFSAPN